MGYLGEECAPTFPLTYLASEFDNLPRRKVPKTLTTAVEPILKDAAPTEVDYLRSAAAPTGNVVPIDEARTKQKVKKHLRMLRHLSADHDGEGASAPIPSSVDEALAFIPSIRTQLAYGPTLNDAGQAVIEFENRSLGVFADVTFHGDAEGNVDCYSSRRGVPSVLVTGTLTDSKIIDLLVEAGIIA